MAAEPLTGLRRRLGCHWFAPASLLDLAMVRIVVVATELVSLLVPGPSSLGRQLWLSHAPAPTFMPFPALKVLMLPFGWGARPGPMFLHAVWIGALVFGILALIGLSWRLALALFAAASTLLIAHAYSYGEMHHGQALLVIALWVLCFAPSGAALSVDALLDRRRRARRSVRVEAPGADSSPFARWPLRLIQWLLVLAYLSAAISKLTMGGLDWLNGYTLAYYFVQDGMIHRDGLALFVARFPAVCALLAAGALLFELTFAVAVLRPRLAWVYVIAGTVMHTTIFVLQHAVFFQFIALYIVFLEPLRATLHARAPARRRVPAAWPTTAEVHPEPGP